MARRNLDESEHSRCIAGAYPLFGVLENAAALRVSGETSCRNKRLNAALFSFGMEFLLLRSEVGLPVHRR